MPLQHTINTVLAVTLSICLVCATIKQPLSADAMAVPSLASHELRIPTR